MSRMMVYAWFDQDNTLAETKFGDHFVSKNLSMDAAIEDTVKYIRTQFPRRGKHFDSGRVLYHVWDVTEAAKQHNKFRAHSHMDDVIRPSIGRAGEQGAEFHKRSFEDVVIRVNQWIHRSQQPLIKAQLSTQQYKIAEEVINLFEDNTVILAELCARFGKTIWSGAVAKEMDADLIVIASYVKTVFTSFATDLTSFEQFADYVHVDTGENDYQDRIENAVQEGKKVIAYLSMANGSRRQERIDYLFSWDVNTLLVVDEADFGSHTAKQADPLISATQGITNTVIMTGTNSDRAATHWPIDHMISVTYPELLIQKEETKKGKKAYQGSLQHFSVNKTRDLLTPDFECYQMDLAGPVNAAIEAGEVDDDFATLPSWTKFGAHPIKAKGFFVRTLESLFLNKGGHDELNVDLQTETFHRDRPRVAMMFISTKRNEMLNMAADIAKEALPGYEVVAINGDSYHYGKKFSNKHAERFVKEIIEKDKPTLILSNNMAQRSFSIPEITELYLAYDKGSEGTTIQKMSRALTPGKDEKVGKIFSLSFDPNRDDKFDSMIMETAQNCKERQESKSLRDALREVLRTIDIFKCYADGSVKVNIDDYLEAALARKGISRVLGKIVDLSPLTSEAITALANGNNDYFRNEKVERTLSGKTRESTKRARSGVSRQDPSQREIAKARETIVTIVENMDIIMMSGSSKYVGDAINELDNEEDRKWVEDEFGVDLELLGFLFEHNIIRQDWVELIHESGV